MTNLPLGSKARGSAVTNLPLGSEARGSAETNLPHAPVVADLPLGKPGSDKLIWVSASAGAPVVTGLPLGSDKFGSRQAQVRSW